MFKNVNGNNQKQLRHCMIVHAIYPLGETRVQREAEALVKRGYDVDVICLRNPGSLAVDSYKDVKIYRENYRSLIKFVKKDGLLEQFLKYINFFFSATFRLIQLNITSRYDSIQVHNLPDFLVFCAIIPKLQKIPIILDLHDLMPEFYSSRFRNNRSLLAGLIRLQERLACRFSDHVITVSEHWRQALIQRGVPDEKCSVVMNVADDSIFHPSDKVFLQNQDENNFRLIYHGAIVERYGLDLIINAINLVKSDIPGIHLTLVGYGDFLPQMLALVKKHRLDRYVTFMDSILAEELPKVIKTCHVGVVPYRKNIFTDGLLPTKLMEYTALGMPAIASRTTAVEAYFSKANTEFFEPGNVNELARCILMLYRNPDRMVELAQGSMKFNQLYNWTKISENYVNLVARLGSGDSLTEV
ncbi:MAG: glycosyltransferase family 4 protein [Anaerolineaceae bacterium]|nr:glycosyltransferase family 4 protein [Anaerolineaceae bacterium]